MRVVLERRIPIQTAIVSLKHARLENTGEQKVYFYKHTEIRLASMHPEELNPVALYLLRKNFQVQRALREHLLNEYGIDTLSLSEVLHLRTESGLIGMIPPYVEISEEVVSFLPREGDRLPPEKQTLCAPLLIDGLHRAYLARELGVSVGCLVVRNTPKEYPYAAYPCSWNQVILGDEVPKVKKFYRRQDPYTFMRPLDVLRQLPKTDTPEYGRKS